jgi:hypothetical protein
MSGHFSVRAAWIGLICVGGGIRRPSAALSLLPTGLLARSGPCRVAPDRSRVASRGPKRSVGIRVESIGDRHRARAVASDQSALPGSLIQRGPWAHVRFLRDPAIVASGLWCIRPRPRLYRMYFDAEPGHRVDRRRPGLPREFADCSPGAEQSTADSDRAPSSGRVRRGHGPQVPVRWSPLRGSEGHSSGKAPTRLGRVEPGRHEDVVLIGSRVGNCHDLLHGDDPVGPGGSGVGRGGDRHLRA